MSNQLYLPRKDFDKPGAHRSNARAMETWARAHIADIHLHHDAANRKTAEATASVALSTGVWSDVTGASVSLDRNGDWLVIGTFHFDINNVTASGRLDVGGVVQAGQASLSTNATVLRATVVQTWIVSVTAQPKTAKLQAHKDGGTAATVLLTNTTLRAIWIGG